MPERIRLSRRKGWRKPPGVITVARPGYWGNPFRIGETPAEVRARDPLLWEWGGLRDLDDAHELTRAEAVEAFRSWMRLAVGRSGHPRSHEAQVELRGHDLACWCSLDGPCHADVLLQIANARDAGDR